ncbi:MAG: hypothetical protein NTX22_08830 [Ignavibacteriales bacterium]|nr:hypothetical protein [Ignavibacteriales bacterium]
MKIKSLVYLVLAAFVFVAFNNTSAQDKVTKTPVKKVEQKIAAKDKKVAVEEKKIAANDKKVAVEKKEVVKKKAVVKGVKKAHHKKMMKKEVAPEAVTK